MNIKAAIGEAVQPVLQGIAAELQYPEAQKAAVERGEQQNADQAHVLKGVRDLLDSRQLLVEKQEKELLARQARASIGAGVPSHSCGQACIEFSVCRLTFNFSM